MAKGLKGRRTKRTERTKGTGKSLSSSGGCRHTAETLPDSRMKRFLPLLILPCLFFAACNKPDSGSSSSGGSKKPTIALLPKSKGNQYFVNVEKGAQTAAQELGVTLLFD